MSSVLDRYVRELEQFRAIESAACTWCVIASAELQTDEYERAVRLRDTARAAKYSAALAYVGANEMLRELAGE